MDGDGTSFSFPSASDFNKDQESNDISWGDIFLDGIHSEESPLEKLAAGEPDIPSETPGPSVITQQVIQQHHTQLQQQQQSIMGGQVHIQIPTHLQGTISTNGLQQTSTSISGSVAYLTPSVTSSQLASSENNFQNVMTAAGQRLVTTSLTQQQNQQSQQQANPKLVQLGASFPAVASVQQLPNSVPLQTLLQSNPTLTNQTLYRSQSGLFPTQGSVHIENPKVVNVNFGPHVIGSDGSSQQALIQTAEGKQVLITNSQLQQMSQSLNLTQPLVGTQLLNQGGGNVLRTTLAQGAQQSVVNQPRQIVLPSGQAVIPRQSDPTAAAKSVVLRQLNPSVSPMIYPGGQGGQLQLQPQSTALITSAGQGLQVVNTTGGQGNQVQLIAQPQQLAQGQQQLNQNALVNLLNSQGVLNNGLVQSGQNILVNGQVVNLNQLAIQQQLQLQQQQQQQQQQQTNAVSLGQAVVNRPVARQLQQQQQIQNQPNTQQQLFFSQNAAGSGGVSVVGNNNAQQQLGGTQIMFQQQQQKMALGLGNPLTNIQQQQGNLRPGGTLTPNNAGSNSSTPAPTPTPSTPTPTPTPDLMLDPNNGNSGKGNHSSNILEQALTMSDIDLQSFEDDFSLLGSTEECMPSVPTTPAPAPTPPVTPAPAKPKPKRQSKKSKAAAQQQPKGQTATVQNTQGKKVTLTPQQKLITTNGQVYVLSANGQQLILQQPSTTSVASIAPQLKPIPSQAPLLSKSNTQSRNISTSASQQRTPQLLLAQNNSSPATGNARHNQSKIPIIPSKMGFQAQKNVQVSVSVDSDNKGFVKTSADFVSNEISSKIIPGKSSSQGDQKSSIPFSSLSASTSGISSFTCSVQPNSQTSSNQVKSQKITTLEGSFVKQEPMLAVVKQEPVPAQELLSSSFSSPQSALSTAPSSVGFQDISQAITSGTTSNIALVSSSLVVSTAMTSTVTTTQFHQSTIMITSPSVGSVAGSHATTTSTANTTTGSKSSSSKEKDPNTIKSMTPVKIANTTLMLSLTPAQKERLEDQLSRMSMREQNDILAHQQNLNKRIQQVQQVHQQKLLQQQQHKQQQQQNQQQQQQTQVSSHQTNQQSSSAPMTTNTTASSPAVLRLPNQKTSVASVSQSHSAPSQMLQFKRQQKPLDQNRTTHSSTASEAERNSAPTLLLPKTVEELESEMSDGKKTVQSIATAFTQAAQLSQQQKKGLGQLHQQQQSLSVSQRQSTQTVQASPVQAGPSQTTAVQPQPVFPPMGICLAEQQLIRDRSLALKPDTNSKFKNFSDAMRRLVRYHTSQDHKPEEDSKTMKTWDTKYTKLCDYLMKKKRYYMRRYQKLRLYHDMCPERRPESLQNLLCFNEQLQELFEAEKEEAKNHPETFQPVRPIERAPTPEEQEPDASPEWEYSMPITSVSREERRASKKAKRKEALYFGSHFKEPLVKEEVTESRTKHEIWESPKPSFSSLKRKCSPERGSSGTLKLVFKRRTTDDFSVKNSIELSTGLKPVVNLEKSDSEYEYDAGCSSHVHQSVKVRRRTSSQSVPSRQTSVCSDQITVNSSNDEENENSSGEEEEEEEKENDGDGSVYSSNSEDDENADEDNEDDEKEAEEMANLDNDISRIGDKIVLNSKTSKRNCHVSFEDDFDKKAVYNNFEDSALQEVRNGRTESDAFMETDDSVIAMENNTVKTKCEKESRNLFASVFKFSDISSGSVSSGKKSGRSFSKSASVTSVASDDVFTSASTPDGLPPATDAVTADNVTSCKTLSLDSLQAINRETSITADDASLHHNLHHSTFQPMASLQSPPLRSGNRKPDISATITVSSSVSNMEKEAASKGLPASSILNTPSKSLLQTDAMFNFSDDDEEDDDNILGSSQSLLLNRFKLNRDPQSSMINDSVRSAINRALIDNDDSNGPEGEDSQASWSSAQRAPSSASSSVAPSAIFRLSSSPSLHSTHDTNLDAAVQSILNG